MNGVDTLRPLFQAGRRRAPRSGGNERLARDERGSSLIEMAVTLPVLFTFLYCFMEVCLAFYSQDLISELAREGTRYAMVHGASCPTSGNPTCEVTASQVNSYVSGLGLPNIAGGTLTPATKYAASGTTSFSTSGPETPGSLVQVQITYTFPITMPLLPRSSFTLTSTSVATIVQ